MWLTEGLRGLDCITKSISLRSVVISNQYKAQVTVSRVSPYFLFNPEFHPTSCNIMLQMFTTTYIYTQLIISTLNVTHHGTLNVSFLCPTPYFDSKHSKEQNQQNHRKIMHYIELEDARYYVAVWFIKCLPLRVPGLPFSGHTTGSSLVLILHFFPYPYQVLNLPPSQPLSFPPHVRCSPSFHVPRKKTKTYTKSY